MYQSGDANGDNKLNADDMFAIKDHVYLEKSVSCAADCNADGSVNIVDMTCVKNKIASADPKVCLYQSGDANHDRVLTNSDYFTIKSCMEKGGCDLCGVDCNADGSITGADLACLKYKMNNSPVEFAIIDNAKLIYNQNIATGSVNKKESVIRSIYGVRYSKISKIDKARIAYFLQNNSSSSELVKLSESYKISTLKKFANAFNGEEPKTESDWQNVLRIQNGLYPKNLSVSAEVYAIDAFKKIYGRDPDFKKFEDEKFIKMTAYGVSELKRDLKKERTAISLFVKKFRKGPKTVYDWNVISALAYSGVVK